jgi:hypothetical protein
MAYKYTASRWTPGNYLFPATIAITDEEVTITQLSFFGYTQRAIPRNQVSSVSVNVGAFFAAIRIESSGAKDIVWDGFSKEDAIAIREALKQLKKTLVN